MSRNKRLGFIFAWIIILTLVLSACGGDQSAPVATQEETSQQQVTAAPADNGQATEAPANNGQATTAPAASGNRLADLGFRPEVNGFSFPNYGPGYTDMTADEMVAIFGDQVCANKDGGKCTLVPPASEVLQQFNKQMEGGHCYGFSTTSLLFYQNQLKVSDFGGSQTIDLPLDGNQLLQRQIARDFIAQFFTTVQSASVEGTPVEVLDKLTEALKAGPKGETYTIGIFKADRTGGHAITPYAVEDRGNGINAILVYDNNWPKMQREILVDRNANSWSYNASINPGVADELYQGDANTKTMQLMPTSPTLSKLNCDFCAGGGQARGKGGNGLAAPAQKYYEIYLDGQNPENHAHLQITNKDGKITGFKDGKFVEEFTEVQTDFVMSGDLWQDSPEPVYHVPVGVDFSITVDGSNLKAADTTDVVILAEGYYIGVEGIGLDPGEKDTITLTADGTGLAYKTAYTEAPTIVVGFENTGSTPDYEFTATGVDITPNGQILVAWDKAQQAVALGTADTTQAGSFDITMTRIDDQGETTFGHNGIELGANDTLYLYYGDWTKGNPLQVGIDQGNTGKVSQTLTLEDQSK